MNINNNNKIQLGGNVLVPIDVKEQEFKKLMLIYKQGMEQVQNELMEVQTSLNKIHDYDVISNINSRIKTPESIIKKMKKKNYDLNYKNLISNVNDIAGVRIVCPFKDDIVKVKNVLENNSKLEILEEKDYIKNGCKSMLQIYNKKEAENQIKNKTSRQEEFHQNMKVENVSGIAKQSVNQQEKDAREVTNDKEITDE